MTKVYFVRHAQPTHSWEDDRTRPLTSDGINDSKRVTQLLRSYSINAFYSSPYKRSMDTILGAAKKFNMDINKDERLRERSKGIDGNQFGMFQKRWDDFDFHEEGGESLSMVQKRNIEALNEILSKHEDQNIVIGTHGTALSTILNYYNPKFKCDDFLRIIDYMPYVICITFNGINYISQEELLIIEKEFKEKNRVDKPKKS